MKRKVCMIISIAIILVVISGCKSSKLLNEDSRISIVTTIFPAYDMTRSIAGDKCDVTMLISPGAEVHTYEPSPKDMIRIQECDLFIFNGGESDVWVEELLASKEYANINVLRMMDCVSAVEEEHKEGMETDKDEVDADEEGETEYDEHVWTSPKNAIKISEVITKELCLIDSGNEAAYKSNSAEYIKKLQMIDNELAQIAQSIDNRTLVFADRFPMRYFAEEYGFNYYAAFPGCSAQTEASSSTIVFLIDKVKDESIPAVFCIEFSTGKLADTICEETGASKYMLHSCHNVSSDDFENGVTYIELMQRNAQTLKEAFGV